jgi:hypothetical protein
MHRRYRKSTLHQPGTRIVHPGAADDAIPEHIVFGAATIPSEPVGDVIHGGGGGMARGIGERARARRNDRTGRLEEAQTGDETRCDGRRSSRRTGRPFALSSSLSA